MTKIIKIASLLLLFTACTQGIIFHDIAKEIELEEPNIIGNVNSIVKLGDSLYAQNGSVYKKELDIIRGWKAISTAGIGRIIALASDANNLYALYAGQTDDEGTAHEYQVWSSINGTEEWKKVDGTYSTSDVILFDNGVIGTKDNTVGRNAYVRIGEKVYLLNGTALGDEKTVNGADENSVIAASMNGVDYFSSTRSFCSNSEDMLYRIGDEDYFETSSDNQTWEKNDYVSVTDDTLVVYAKDRLYVGTTLGLEQVILAEEGGEPESKSNLTSNAEATTGEKEIISIGFFGDIDGNAIYVGAIEQYSTTYNGFWGYYPSRGNWNFE